MTQQLDYFGKIKTAILDLGRQLDGDYVKKQLSELPRNSYEMLINEKKPEIGEVEKEFREALLKRNEIVMGAILEISQKHKLDEEQIKMLVIVLSDSIGKLIEGNDVIIPAQSAALRLDELKEQLSNGWQKYGEHYIVFPSENASTSTSGSALAKSMETKWGSGIKRVIASIVGNVRSAHKNVDGVVVLEQASPEYKFEGKGEGIAVTADGLSRIQEVLGITINPGLGQGGRG